jgi:hypothetical protein
MPGAAFGSLGEGQGGEDKKSCMEMSVVSEKFFFEILLYLLIYSV